MPAISAAQGRIVEIPAASAPVPSGSTVTGRGPACRLRDGVRVLDVPAALSARTYGTEPDVVLDGSLEAVDVPGRGRPRGRDVHSDRRCSGTHGRRRWPWPPTPRCLHQAFGTDRSPKHCNEF